MNCGEHHHSSVESLPCHAVGKGSTGYRRAQVHPESISGHIPDVGTTPPAAVRRTAIPMNGWILPQYTWWLRLLMRGWLLSGSLRQRVDGVLRHAGRHLIADERASVGRRCEAAAMAQYPCPCCGYLVFDEEPGSYDICKVCGWEDDLSQLRFATMGGGANRASLVECQQRFIASNAAEPSRDRDPQWRPLDVSIDHVEVPEPGREYGMTYPDDRTAYYYWRR